MRGDDKTGIPTWCRCLSTNVHAYLLCIAHPIDTARQCVPPPPTAGLPPHATPRMPRPQRERGIEGNIGRSAAFSGSFRVRQRV